MATVIPVFWQISLIRREKRVWRSNRLVSLDRFGEARLLSLSGIHCSSTPLFVYFRFKVSLLSFPNEKPSFSRISSKASSPGRSRTGTAAVCVCRCMAKILLGGHTKNPMESKKKQKKTFCQTLKKGRFWLCYFGASFVSQQVMATVHKTSRA